MTKNPSVINYSNRFKKQLKKAPIEIKIAFLKRREMFNQNPFHPQLNNHALTGKFKRHRSISITGDWRAIYSEHREGKNLIIIFELLGTHSQLYK